MVLFDVSVSKIATPQFCWQDFQVKTDKNKNGSTLFLHLVNSKLFAPNMIDVHFYLRNEMGKA